MGWAETFAAAAVRWGGNSGSGSDPELAGPYCRFIERYLQRHAVRSVLDLGCGDLRIAQAIRWGDASWAGVDFTRASPRVIQGDLRTCWWPAADLVLIKDVLQHWPNADIEQLLPRLQAYPRVLITNSASGLATNADIAAGDVRSLDLAAAPFCWPVREIMRWLGDEYKSVVELRRRPAEQVSRAPVD